MTELTREQILSIVDLKPQGIQIEEWGGTVFIRPMNALERAEWEGYVFSSSDTPKAKVIDQARERLAVLSICDAQGKRLFTDADIPELGKKNAIALERIGQAAMRLNKLTPKDIRDLAKN